MEKKVLNIIIIILNNNRSKSINNNYNLNDHSISLIENIDKNNTYTINISKTISHNLNENQKNANNINSFNENNNDENSNEKKSIENFDIEIIILIGKVIIIKIQ